MEVWPYLRISEARANLTAVYADALGTSDDGRLAASTALKQSYCANEAGQHGVPLKSKPFLDANNDELTLITHFRGWRVLGLYKHNAYRHEKKKAVWNGLVFNLFFSFLDDAVTNSLSS